MSSPIDESMPYKGMSTESSEAYEERQRAPLFQNAKNMIPMEKVKEFYDNLACSNAKIGCRIQKRAANLAWCHFCRMLRSKGSEFFDAERLITAAELAQATDWQKEEHEKQWEKWDKWTRDYPFV